MSDIQVRINTTANTAAVDKTTASLNQLGTTGESSSSRLRAAFQALGATWKGIGAQISASVRGAVTAAFERMSAALTPILLKFNQLASESKLVRAALLGVKLTLGGVRMAARGVRAAVTFVRGALVKLGVALASITAAFAIFIAIGNAIAGLFGKIRSAVEGTGDSMGGAAKALNESADAADDAADSYDNAVDTMDNASQKAQVVLGAFGDVGAGFVQRAGRVVEDVKDQADDANSAMTSVADTAVEAMEAASAAAGGATDSTSRFGDAIDRIGAAWKKAGAVVMKALAKAITPALEALADLMESETFENFVELIAEKLAKAVEKLANWFITKAVPALEKWMDEIVEAGGFIDWLIGKAAEVKDTWQQNLNNLLLIFQTAWNYIYYNIIVTVVDLITGYVSAALTTIQTGFENLFKDGGPIDRVVSGVVGFFQDVFGDEGAIATLVASVVTLFTNAFATGGSIDIALGQVEGAFSTVFGADGTIAGFVSAAWSGILSAFENGVNLIITALNVLIQAYNSIIETLGGTPLDLIPEFSFTDTSGQNAGFNAGFGGGDLGGGGGGNIGANANMMQGTSINIYVTANDNTPETFGAAAADSFIAEARALGLRV
jgi:hypothetical protein